MMGTLETKRQSIRLKTESNKTTLELTPSVEMNKATSNS